MGTMVSFLSEKGQNLRNYERRNKIPGTINLVHFKEADD
jgi:hypothetical protein